MCGLLARALALTGHHHEALAFARNAIAIAEQLHDEHAARDFRKLLATIGSDGEGVEVASNPISVRIRDAMEQADSGNPAAAIRNLEALINEASASNAAELEITAHLVLAKILKATGQRRAVGAHLRAALAIAERLGDNNASAGVFDMLQAFDAVK